MVSKEAFMDAEGREFPGRTYVEELLKPVFESQRDYLFDSMFALHKAHVVMLREQNLLEADETAEILRGIQQLEGNDHSYLKYQPEYEDLFFMMESKLGSIVGDDIAGKVHMARSRNDMGEGMYRFVLRNKIIAAIENLDALSEAVLVRSKEFTDAVMPAHTHTQPAQPTTFGHYLLAIFDNLQRDRQRLINAYTTVNNSPLGAAAITTTGFPINRSRLAELLGFENILENSYDAIGTGDYLLETAQSIISLMVNTGRWIQEFLRFATHEVGLIEVAAPYVQISSIMPQKRNPVSIEHSRALASKAVGKANAVIQMLHNTPYGDIVDTEDDLQPMLYSSFQDTKRVLNLMHAVILTMSFNKESGLKQASRNLIVITEFADVLTRDHNITFRKAHSIASKVAQQSDRAGRELYDWDVSEINQHLEGAALTTAEWQQIVDPEVFVERRSIQGGPSPKEVERMITGRENKIKDNQLSISNMKEQLEKAKDILDQKVEQLIKR